MIVHTSMSDLNCHSPLPPTPRNVSQKAVQICLKRTGGAAARNVNVLFFVAWIHLHTLVSAGGITAELIMALSFLRSYLGQHHQKVQFFFTCWLGQSTEEGIELVQDDCSHMTSGLYYSRVKYYSLISCAKKFCKDFSLSQQITKDKTTIQIVLSY